MLRRVLAILLAGSAALVGGCSTDQQPEDELMVTDTPVAASAAQSPPLRVAPAGTVTALPGVVTSMAVDTTTRVLAVAVRQPPTVRLYRLDELTAQPHVVTLPGPAEELRMAADSGPLLATVGGESQLVHITLPGGLARSTPLDGAPVSASQLNDRTLVAMRDRKAVAVLDGGGVQRVISGSMFSADQVLSIGGRAVVLDRLRTAVFELDVNAGTVGRGLRAGQGATNAVTDRFGRVLVADTRGGALLAFSLDPLLLRQRYPVPGGPFGMAYDPARDVVWVTLTGSNEVVGYHVAGEEPQERFRFPTVEQPNSVTVDPVSGRVIIASATGGGIQVVPT